MCHHPYVRMEDAEAMMILSPPYSKNGLLSASDTLDGSIIRLSGIFLV